MAPKNRNDKNDNRLESVRPRMDAAEVKKALAAFVGVCGSAAAAATIAMSIGTTTLSAQPANIKGDVAVAKVVPAPTTLPADPAKPLQAQPVMIGGAMAPVAVTQPATQPTTQPTTQATTAPATQPATPAVVPVQAIPMNPAGGISAAKIQPAPAK